MHAKITGARRVAAVCILLAFFVFFAFDLVKIQIIDAEKYDAASSAVSEQTARIAAARGEIVDCYGKKLVYNDQGYSIIFDYAYFPPSSAQAQRNQIILSLINLFEQNSLEWIDNLPLVFDANGNIAFKEDSDSLISQMKSEDMLNLNEYATAQNCFDALIEDYDLQQYPPEQARKIASVCYEMKRLFFSIGYPYTFATDVPDEIVSLIKENSGFYQGVDVEVVPVRQYADGTLAPHLLGRIGAIDADEYKELKSEGYKITDFIGKSGIESAMEKYLKGSDGEETVYRDSEGNRSTKVTVKPIPGNTVVLTIDAGLQKVTQDALRKTLLDFAGSKEGNMVDDAGAAVVIDCKNGDVLASVSYPNYDISTYSENVKALNEDPAAPLWNRALLSTYATGSTMKPSVAIAALEEGLIEEDTTIYCSGSYEYLGQHFKCEQSHDTRFVNVVNALDESCNTFFYETGKNLGIEKMNEYRTLFGLGSKTGCELGEATGVLDSPEYRASLSQKWLPGYTVQSAIGQAGNLFSPIQLANYCATLANGGTRYKTRFVKSIKSYDYSQTILENDAEIVAQMDISDSTLDIVTRGMAAVGARYKTSYFSGLNVNVACKTGTSQEIRKLNGISVKINNGFLIAFAPYENPEIAIAVVGEGFTAGGRLAPVVAEVVDYYFGQSDTMQNYQQENVLIP